MKMFQDDLSYISDFLSFLHIPQHRLTRDEQEDEEEEDGEMPQEARERLLLVKVSTVSHGFQIAHFR